MIISKISPNINNYNQTSKNLVKDINFTSAATSVERAVNPLTKKYDEFTSFLARGFGKILDTDAAVNLVKETTKPKNKQFSEKLISHLTVASSTILSSLYIKRTLENDKLDVNKRRTLAINQASVWGASTIIAYTIDSMANKKINIFIDKFVKLNKGDGLEKVRIYRDGIKAAKSMMIFDVVYRYIAPVAATPIAYYIGNKIQEKKEAELANAQKLGSR